MESRPLSLPEKDVSDLPNGESSYPSAARGRETRTAILQKLRPPTLVHAWDFWYEKPLSAGQPRKASDSASPSTAKTSPPSTADPPLKNVKVTSPYTKTITTPHFTTLTHLHSITDVRHFWSLFNNFSFSSLPTRVSVHLFHNTIRPLWEDPRNTSGGNWTFRVPRAQASPFFRALALLAIGEKLQEAIRDEDRFSFRDDICGISMSVRGEKSCNVSVWNRDGGNEVGKKTLLETILQNMPPELKPVDGSYYYKRHNEHMGFGEVEKGRSASLAKIEEGKAGQTELEEAEDKNQEVSEAVLNVEKEFEKVRKILGEVKLKDEEMGRKLAVEIERQEDRAEEERTVTSKENEAEPGLIV